MAVSNPSSSAQANGCENVGNACRVPVLFEEYLDAIGATPDRVTPECPGCFRADLPMWRVPGPNDTIACECEACLRTAHGTDSTEASLVGAMIGGAVTAALPAGVSPDLIRTTVHEALAAHARKPSGHRVEEDEQ